MNYMVVDLEFNQGFSFEKKNKRVINLECPFEIIDIGAVKLDEDLNTIATFDELVKPVIYKRLHPFVEKLTGISRESLKAEKPFEEARSSRTCSVLKQNGFNVINVSGGTGRYRGRLER